MISHSQNNYTSPLRSAGDDNSHNGIGHLFRGSATLSESHDPGFLVPANPRLWGSRKLSDPRSLSLGGGRTATWSPPCIGLAPQCPVTLSGRLGARRLTFTANVFIWEPASHSSHWSDNKQWKKLINYWLSNKDLRDASASKKVSALVGGIIWTVVFLCRNTITAMFRKEVCHIQLVITWLVVWADLNQFPCPQFLPHVDSWRLHQRTFKCSKLYILA